MGMVAGLLAGWSIASAQEVVWKQGFNSTDTVSWDDGSFGMKILPFSAITNPDGKRVPKDTEGDAFGFGITQKKQVSGTEEYVGRIVFKVVDQIAEAGVTYEFSGKIGWRYGTAEAASDLLISTAGGSGFFPDAKTPGSRLSGPKEPVLLGAAAEKTWTVMSWGYTTAAKDIGKPLYVWIQLTDKNNAAGLTQVIVDDWVVVKKPPFIVLGML